MGIDLGRFKAKKDDEWAEWLKDDPIPSGIRSRMRTQAVQQASQPRVRHVSERQHAYVPKPVTAPKKQESSKDAAVSIHISIPKLKSPKQGIKSLVAKVNPHKKWVIIGAGSVILLVGVPITLQMTKNDKDTGTDTAVLAEKTEKANFEYSLPDGDASEANGTVKYDATKKVVNYQDDIGGVAITISQQPLPSGFKEDTEAKVKKLAEDFAATKTIATANPTAYVGTSAKGPQTVIFSKKDLLVFIQSAKEIDDKDWAEYITNLK